MHFQQCRAWTVFAVTAATCLCGTPSWTLFLGPEDAIVLHQREPVHIVFVHEGAKDEVVVQEGVVVLLASWWPWGGIPHWHWHQRLCFPMLQGEKKQKKRSRESLYIQFFFL